MISIFVIVVLCAAFLGFGVIGETRNRRPCPHRHELCGNKPCFIYRDPIGGEK